MPTTPNPRVKIASSARTIASTAPGTCKSMRWRFNSAAKRSSRGVSVAAVFCDATTDCASASAGNPTRLTLTKSKAEIERPDTWTVMSCKSCLASLQVLVAQRDAFLTPLGLEEEYVEASPLNASCWPSGLTGLHLLSGGRVGHSHGNAETL